MSASVFPPRSALVPWCIDALIPGLAFQSAAAQGTPAQLALAMFQATARVVQPGASHGEASCFQCCLSSTEFCFAGNNGVQETNGRGAKQRRRILLRHGLARDSSWRLSEMAGAVALFLPCAKLPVLVWQVQCLVAPALSLLQPAPVLSHCPLTNTFTHLGLYCITCYATSTSTVVHIHCYIISTISPIAHLPASFTDKSPRLPTHDAGIT